MVNDHGQVCTSICKHIQSHCVHKEIRDTAARMLAVRTTKEQRQLIRLLGAASDRKKIQVEYRRHLVKAL